MTAICCEGSCRSAFVTILVSLFLCFVNSLAFAATNNVVGDSTDAELDTGTNSKSLDPSTLTDGSIQDLFRDYSDDLSRLSAAYELIGTADEAKLVDLFDQATERNYAKEDRAWKFELISLISAQLASLNLEKTVSLYDAQPLEEAKYMLYGITHAWASKDFDGAVEFARKQDTSIHQIALRGIIDASLSLPEATLMDLGTEFGDSAYVERAVRAHQLAVDLANPDEAWTELINDPTSHLEKNFFRIKHVAKAMIDKYGVSEIDNLLSSIVSPTLRFKLRKSILSKVALSEPESAFDYALTTPNDVFGSMLTSVINTWARIDPDSALTRVSLLEPSRVRDRLQQTVVSSWVQLDPTKFLNSVDSVPSELRDTARMHLIAQLSNESIEDALTVLLEMSEAAKQEQAALIIVDSWLDSDPDAAFHWVVSDSEIEGYRDRLLKSFLEKLTDQNADKAIDLALSRPIKGAKEIGLEAIVIDELSFSDTDVAMRLLNRVRTGPTQLAAFESVSRGLIFKKRTDEAIELGKSLPKRAQTSFYDSMTFSIATQEPLEKILEILPNIPAKNAQSEIAENVLLFSSFQEDKEPLSSEDVDTLMEYVNPSELQRVKLLLSR
ncbi:MAG: hypothetical protein F4X56_02565 [Gammaproteobacteria bacterium]|nr:hypothetical protein [Gammaproteobacteria bacterium]